MRPVLALLFIACLSAVIGLFDAATVAMISLIVAGSFSIGRIIGDLLGIDEPFGEFTLGFTFLSYLILVALTLLPLNAHWILSFLLLFVVLHAVYCLLAKRFLQSIDVSLFAQLFCGAMAAALTVIWNFDNFARLRNFDLTGKLNFWIDLFVHAARLSELGGRIAAGRGNALLADFPTPAYHFASYAPSALVLAVTDDIPLNVAALIWIPMGFLVMLTGIISLGYALGGQRLAVWLILAVALIPAIDGFPLYNGFFSSPWLLEVSPGSLYALGGSCTAIALLILWMKGGRWPLLAGACLMTLAMFFVRGNFFVWLAPLMGLVTIFGSRRSVGKTLPLSQWAWSGLGVFTLIIGLVGLSWFNLTEGAHEFLFSYLRSSHVDNSPTAYDGIFTGLQGNAETVALALSLPLILLAIQGVWLPLFLVLGARVWSIGLLRPWDSIPIFLMIITAVFTFLGPVPPNGDISEFRHRAIPLLLFVTVIWTVKFACMLVESSVKTPSHWRAHHRWAISLAATASLAIVSFTIAQAKAPRMKWGSQFYGQVFSRDLAEVAKALRARADRQSRFVVAGGSPDARLVDDAAVIVALSGVPAFMSCPQSVLLRADRYGDDARRRVPVQVALDSAASLEELHRLMALNHITQYIVLDSAHATFDPNRSYADWRGNGVAVYEAGKD